ncbi:PLP-dependent aminotransferase family protein [Ihubacter massiliensis]|uniref:PLP-dependent aminotransferase family protein n=1 Tax=Hominibacterium faecale TaxID=2839743 RepID=A0A9J6QVZ3_9FIRM|nr:MULTISPECIES: PLP-dependent aminotransferase family protein [Eubacteriales Family XIII. Incertae Sedis]MCO7123324.1 PLP-dependent aminotransferase family protein [Ihubacter massiliensis]MCU7379787.1 PLP-dependent aminotransferase family protein [Hominibacterium faecale]
MIILDRASKIPLYTQIYQHIREEIISGELEEGHRLSAIRTQAENLGVSRNTVELAYLQLCSEGYLKNKRGSGYYVKHVDASLIDKEAVTKRMQEYHRARSAGRSYRYDMRYGNCHMDEFPLGKWRKAMDQALCECGNKLAAYGDSCGDLELRTYLADYLERARGVTCGPQQIIIGGGTQQLLSILVQLVKPKRCAIEEPGYDGVRAVLENHQVEPVPVQVGRNGIDLELLKEERIDAVYVTPSHQFPLGAVMPIQTRMELIQMAQKGGFYIIEDDYDSIFRYSARSIPSMQGLDPCGKVIYLGSTSKAMAPSLRLAYMVLPAELKNRYDMWFSQYHNTVSATVQDALRIFMAEGSWERHVRKICLANKRKHDILVSELEKGLGPDFRLLGKGAGLHLIVESRRLTGEEMMVRIERQGVKVYSMDKYFALGCKRNLIMAGFGGIRQEDIRDAAERILRALKN